MNAAQIIADALQAEPRAAQYIGTRARLIAAKAAPITRDELERKLARLILLNDRRFLAILEEYNGNVPFTFWQEYETTLRAEIASPLRQYIEQSFTNYSDYVNFIDRAGAVADIDTAMTRAITEVARGVTETTQRNLAALISEGVAPDEIIERIALRFSSGHAEQVSITEITRAEGYFSDALQSRLSEQGVQSKIRWLTAEDEKVCPICGPADHKLKDQPITSARGGWTGETWGDRFGRPPAHPNCRCQTVVELIR